MFSKKELQSLVASGNIKKVLDVLITNIDSIDDSNLRNSILIIVARFNKLQLEKNDNTIHYSEYEVEYNKLLAAIINTINKIKDKELPVKALSKPSDRSVIKILNTVIRKNPIILGFSAIVVVALLLFYYNKPQKIFTELNDGNEVRYLTLPNKVDIILYPYSRLTYPLKECDPYLVKMEGEVKFDIPDMNDIDFYVLSENLIFTTTGAKFKIKSNPRDSVIEIFVNKGIVELKEEHHKNDLLARVQKSERLMYLKSSKKIIKTNLSLEFRQTKLSVALSIIEKRFNINISTTPLS